MIGVAEKLSSRSFEELSWAVTSKVGGFSHGFPNVIVPSNGTESAVGLVATGYVERLATI